MRSTSRFIRTAHGGGAEKTDKNNNNIIIVDLSKSRVFAFAAAALVQWQRRCSHVGGGGDSIIISRGRKNDNGCGGDGVVGGGMGHFKGRIFWQFKNAPPLLSFGTGARGRFQKCRPTRRHIHYWTGIIERKLSSN